VLGERAEREFEAEKRASRIAKSFVTGFIGNYIARSCESARYYAIDGEETRTYLYLTLEAE